jgi:hypothetical protein
MLIGDWNKKSNMTAFGWNHSTHRLITERAVQEANRYLPSKLEFNYGILKYSCVEPDFSRKNITKYIHGHFADIDNLQKDPPDAFVLAKKYSSQAIEAHRNGFYKKRDDYLGYALHFVQDALNPVHVVFVPAPKGDPIRTFHKQFETLAASIQTDVLKGKTFNLQDENFFFEKTFPEAMRKTKNLLGMINQNDTENLSFIATQAIENTYEMTSLFLKKLAVKLNSISSPSVKYDKTLNLFENMKISA